MCQRHTGMSLAACKTDNSRKAGGDDYIRGAVGGPEPPLSPFSTGQNPVSPSPLFAAAGPVLPFELQPCLYGSLAASRVEIQVPLPQKQSNVQFVHKEQCVLTRKFPFILYGTVSGLGGRRSDANEACLCRYVHVGMRAATWTFNWFRQRRGRFFVCFVLSFK